MIKPIVHYVPDYLHDYIKLGESATVVPQDHYSHLVSNTRPVHTSLVVAIHDDGFETENTRYAAIRP